PPTLATAPPPAVRPSAWLFARTSCERLTLAPWLSSPPPSAPPAGTDARPLAIVRSSIVASVALPLTRKTRLVLLPLTVSLFALGPLIVRSSVMLSSPLVRVMVPFNPPANWTTSAPGVVLAAVIAARSEPGSWSERLVTVKVLGRVRSSRASRVRYARGGAQNRVRRGEERRLML